MISKLLVATDGSDTAWKASIPVGMASNLIAPIDDYLQQAVEGYTQKERME
jgi:hypothetical protein